MRKSCLLLSLVILLFVSSALFAGITGKIAGSIIAARTGEALPGANVVIVGTQLGAASDINGYFMILNIAPGTYDVQATMMGYKTTTITGVRVKIDYTTAVDFSLDQEVLAGEEVIVIAERPVIELDLTASKQTLSKTQIEQSWGTDVDEVISDLPGVNINGGIRGGFGLDVAYHLDGMDMRDIGSNTNFSSINLTTIQEMEILTGGWNAEYGQANGAIMNIVTKNASDRIHGIVSYKMRPAGKYHWGNNIYNDPNDIWHTIMTTPEFWDPNSTWQTKWMEEPLPGYSGDVEPYVSMTPEERAAWWKEFVNNRSLHPQIGYAERMQWESEMTIYGPITKKLGIMFSGRYREGVPRYPSALKYNPDMTFQGSLDYKISSNTKLNVTGVYTKFENTGAPKTNYNSSEDTDHDAQYVPFIPDPYNRYKYWLYGATSSSEWNIRAPEYANMLNLQAKLTHVFSPNTFLDVAFQHSESEYRQDYRDIMRSAVYGPDGLYQYPDPQTIPKVFTTINWDRPGDIYKSNIWSKNNSIKADFVSQLNKHHQLKAGLLFAFQSFDKVFHDHQQKSGSWYAYVTDLAKTEFNPYEGAFYIQDKIEFEGMVINAGLRLDYFNGNKNVSANFFDPLMIGDSTAGNIGEMGHISWDPEGSGPGYKKLPTQVAISPRLGISHAISENTVLHFMFGKFNQRPPWQKIVGPVIVATLPPDDVDSDWVMHPDSQLVYYNFYTGYMPNPALTWEKMTQYEVGFEQNIADMFSLDITMYYKDAYDLTSRGIQQGPGNLHIAESGGSVETRMYGDPRNPTGRIFGTYQGYFETLVNGGWADVRGIEVSFETKFRYFNMRANYTMSFLNTGAHHLEEIYKEWGDGKLGIDQYRGASNTDGGRNGTDDDSWNPHNTATLKFHLFSPKNFGPVLAGIHPLGGWSISTSTRWTDGRVFTYHAPDDVSTEPNNRKWKDRWSTNMNLSKTFILFGDLKAKFSIQATNLFNQKHLKLPSGSDREEYFENGNLPFNNTTKEPLVWEWYSNRPREIYFGLSLEY